MLEKKAGGIINRLIDWQLFNNSDLVIDLKNVNCSYDNSILLFNEDEVKNEININNNMYIRTAKDYTMQIDFNNNTGFFKFENGEECTLGIDGYIRVEDNTITVSYCYDTDIKKIIINIKEVNDER